VKLTIEPKRLPDLIYALSEMPAFKGLSPSGPVTLKVEAASVNRAGTTFMICVHLTDDQEQRLSRQITRSELQAAWRS
jgi:hypothetical protein